jgi:hypothetical protein
MSSSKCWPAWTWCDTLLRCIIFSGRGVRSWSRAAFAAARSKIRIATTTPVQMPVVTTLLMSMLDPPHESGGAAAALRTRPVRQGHRTIIASIGMRYLNGIRTQWTHWLGPDRDIASSLHARTHLSALGHSRRIEHARRTAAIRAESLGDPVLMRPCPR